MKIKEKFLVMGIGVALVSFIISPIQSNAVLQANGNAGAKANLATWLLNVRKMEETGGTLGLSDTINSTDLTSSAEQKNNIDIHMQKNTEYGAMAILSASAYGNPKKVNNGETTTGNKTGVYINLNREWVSAGQLTGNASFINANTKYKNAYTTTYVAKLGDAIKETEGWHTSSGGALDYNSWLTSSDDSGLLRAYSDTIFVYSGFSTHGSAATSSQSNFSRAVIVVGNGF